MKLKIYCQLLRNMCADSIHQSNASMKSIKHAITCFRKMKKSGKIVDLSVIPPCSSVLRNQMFRAAYIANMWKNSKTAYIEQYQIDEYGWNRDGSMFWTDKSFPDDLEQIMEDEEYEKLCQEVPPFDESISEDEMGF